MAQKGITLISLIITIIILLILAGITIGAVTGENSLINQAEDAKENAEIASEKEAIDNATIEAMGKNKYGNLEENEFQEALDNQTNGKATVIDIGESFEVFFTESNRYYSVDKNGNIGDFMLAVTDPYPGDITKDENGNMLDGSKENPYQINCIEDLVAFSNMTNGTGVIFEDGNIKQLTSKNTFMNKYIIITRNLNFKSNTSYINSKREDFGDINENGEVETLMVELTTGKGFNPISDSKETVIKFLGHFNETSDKIIKIENLYINREEENVGLFGSVNINGSTNAGQVTIENLHITGNITGLNVGGIFGNITVEYVNDVKIENCINEASITGKARAGGIVGMKHGNITLNINNCENRGRILSDGTNDVYAGGIIGYVQKNLSIVNCANLQTVEHAGRGTGYEGAGGIVAYAGSNVNILNSYNQGKIISNNNAGGIIGWGFWSERYVINCYNSGELEGVSVGGIVGKIESSNEILVTKNCYYINKNISKGIGNWDSTKEAQEDIIGKSETELKAEEILNAFNGIEESSDFDITTFNKWKKGENGYPKFE